MGVPAHPRSVAITIDDLPYAPGRDRPAITAEAAYADSINRAIISALVQDHVPVTGFVIQSRVEQLGDSAGVRIVKRWTDAGLALGNHSYSHADFNQLTLDQIESEIILGETTIHRAQFFRFPFNHTGDTKAKHDSISGFLSARGYHVATCTIENSDWVFNGAYVRLLGQNDTATAARVRAAYLEYTKTQIAYFSALNTRVMGYEPPEVMLLHDNKLNADALDQILALFRHEHYQFVSLAAAQSDPAYLTPDTVITPDGPMWGYRWARARHVAVNGALEQDPPAWILDLYRN